MNFQIISSFAILIISFLITSTLYMLDALNEIITHHSLPSMPNYPES